MIQLYLLLQQKNAKIQVVHTLTNLIHRHLMLGSLHLPLPADKFLMALDGASIIDHLTHIHSNTILVFPQPLQVNSHLGHHRLHLVGPRHHITLIGALCGGRHLRQPSFIEIVNFQFCHLLYQPILPYERIVLFGSLLTLF